MQSQTTSPRLLRVFLCHASEDKPVVRSLYHRLKACNIEVWFDEENLVGGQDWDLEIQKMVRSCDVFIACLTPNFIVKEGYGQKEIKLALDTVLEMPEEANYLIPLLLENCRLPLRLQRFHAIYYFEENGFNKLIKALQYRIKNKNESLHAGIVPIDCQSSLQGETIPSTSQQSLPLKSVKTLTHTEASIPPNSANQPSPLPPTPRNVLSKGRVSIGIALLLLISLFITSTIIFQRTYQGISSTTPTPTATLTPTATTVPISSSAPYGGTLVLNDPLHDNSNGYGWDETKAHCTFNLGAYHVTTSNPNNYECNTISPRTDFRNFAYQVTMKIDKGNQGGICFRFIVNDQTGYCFFFNLIGQYVLEKVNFNTPTEDMMETGRSNYFLTGLGKTNQIAVRARGKTIDLFINRHFIQSATDSTYSHGQIGVFLVYPGYFTEAEFTDAKVWAL